MIRLLCVGKVKDRRLSELIGDYVDKIARYHKISVEEVKDEKIGSDEEAVKDREAERLLERIRDDEYVILLDLHGKALDSMAFAKLIDDSFIRHPKLTFVIGGSLGLGKAIVKRSDVRIRLSDLTFLHQMTRLILAEQIYRSFKLLNHETYHK